MSENDNILGRIKEALKERAPLPGHGEIGHQQTAAHQGDAALTPRQWLPGVGPSLDDRISLFQKNAVDLKATFRLFDGQIDLENALRDLAKSEGWKKIATHGDVLTAMASRVLPIQVCRADQGLSTRELESCDAGLTACDALIAQTGSVLVTSKSAGGRALSVLPPHHVVIARRDQMLADLPEAFAYLKKTYEAHYPSFISFITGPSRTGDIERILVLGAHGPKRLSIFCF